MSLFAAQHRQRVKPNGVPAVIVQNRQRVTLSHWQRIFPLGVHLPKFVRLAALETRQCRTMAVFADQLVTFENAMDGSHRQGNLFLCQQHMQLLRSPARLLAQSNDPLLPPGCGEPWAMVWPPTTLPQSR